MAWFFVRLSASNLLHEKTDFDIRVLLKFFGDKAAYTFQELRTPEIEPRAYIVD